MNNQYKAMAETVLTQDNNLQEGDDTVPVDLSEGCSLSAVELSDEVFGGEQTG